MQAAGIRKGFAQGIWPTACLRCGGLCVVARGIACAVLFKHSFQRQLKVYTLGIGQADQGIQQVRHLRAEVLLGLVQLLGFLAIQMVDNPRQLTQLLRHPSKLSKRLPVVPPPLAHPTVDALLRLAQREVSRWYVRWCLSGCLPVGADRVRSHRWQAYRYRSAPVVGTVRRHVVVGN